MDRHGETEREKEKVYYGSSSHDFELTGCAVSGLV